MSKTRSELLLERAVAMANADDECRRTFHRMVQERTTLRSEGWLMGGAEMSNTLSELMGLADAYAAEVYAESEDRDARMKLEKAIAGAIVDASRWRSFLRMLEEENADSIAEWIKARMEGGMQ